MNADKKPDFCTKGSSAVGRPSKPTTLKLLHGDRPDRVNTSEPTPALGEVKPPTWLSKEARAMWDRLAPDLITKGVLTPWDVDTFAVACSSFVTFRKAQRDVDRRGHLVKGYRNSKVKNPSLQVARDAWQTFITAAAKFGLTPSDRAKIAVGGGNQDDTAALFS